MQTLITPNLNELKEELNLKASGMRDAVFQPSDLRVEWNKSTIKYFSKAMEDQLLNFSDSAFGQYLNRIGVPVAFYRRCPHRIQGDIFTHFNQKYDKGYFFRFDDRSGKNHVRAVLSEGYSVIDDKDLFDIIFEVLQGREDVSYRVFRYDDRITQLMIDFHDCTGVHNGTTYVAGLCITNSETGHSSVWIEPVVHIPQVTFHNRRVLKGQGVDCRIVHRGKLARERVGPMVEKAKEVAQVGITQLAEAFGTTVTRDHALRFAESVDAFPSRFVQLLEEEWGEDERIIKAEAARRMILLAQELPLFQRISVEQSAGKMLGLFKNYKSRFSDLAQEIQENE